MNPNDPNVKLVEDVVAALGPLCDGLVLVGGAAAGFLITDPGQPRIRATNDVDMVLTTVTRMDYYAMERELERRGFSHDLHEGAPICRWVIGSTQMDLMSPSPDVLGFANPWYPHVLKTAWTCALSAGFQVRVIDGPCFIATKLAAFDDRGKGDYMASHDLEDVLAIADGRAELHEEVRAAEPVLRGFIARRLTAMLADRRFVDSLPGHLPPDNASQARLPDLKHHLRTIAALA